MTGTWITGEDGKEICVGHRVSYWIEDQIDGWEKHFYDVKNIQDFDSFITNNGYKRREIKFKIEGFTPEPVKHYRYHCSVCKSGIADERCCRIERGDFDDEDRNNDNIKYNCFLCKDCFLNDEDLCRFFNKIGDRIR